MRGLRVIVPSGFKISPRLSRLVAVVIVGRVQLANFSRKIAVAQNTGRMTTNSFVEIEKCVTKPFLAFALAFLRRFRSGLLLRKYRFQYL